MTGTQKRYDNKYKVTRLLLADYLMIKELAQRAGVSMAEALHKIITKDLARAEPREVVTQILMPVTSARAKSTPIQRITVARSTPVTMSISREVKSGYRYRQTNGH